MAFCPHCGSSITEQASECAACGHALPTAVAAKPKGRFKGTMIAMGGRSPAEAAAPPADPVGAPAPGGTIPMPGLNKAPPPAPPPIGSATSGGQVGFGTATAAKKKHGTMLGVGGTGLAVPSALQPGTSAPEPVAESPVATAAAPAEPASAPTPEALPPVSPPKSSSAARSGHALARSPATQPEGRALAPSTRPSSTRPRAEGRFVAGSIPPAPPGPGMGKLIAIGVGGMVLIAAAGYAMALFLGLAH